MTNELVELIPGLVSGSDLSNKANLYHVVKLSAANTVALAGAVSDMLLGVLVNCPAAGEGCCGRWSWIYRWVCRWRFSIGRRLHHD